MLDRSVEALAERLHRPRASAYKALCGQRWLNAVKFVDWCDALEWDDPLAVINSVRRR